jgi:hypothetical protein
MDAFLQDDDDACFDMLRRTAGAASETARGRYYNRLYCVAQKK